MKKNILKKVFPILIGFVLTSAITTSCKKQCTCYTDGEDTLKSYVVEKESAEECNEYFAALTDTTVVRCTWE